MRYRACFDKSPKGIEGSERTDNAVVNFIGWVILKSDPILDSTEIVPELRNTAGLDSREDGLLFVNLTPTDPSLSTPKLEKRRNDQEMLRGLKLAQMTHSKNNFASSIGAIVWNRPKIRGFTQ